MSLPILVVNAGSSSVKVSVFDSDPDRPGNGSPGAEHPDGPLSVAVSGRIEGIGTAPHFVARTGPTPEHPDGIALTDIRWEKGPGHHGALAALALWLEAHFDGAPVGAVGHRVVHGGTRFAAPVLIDAGVLAALAALVPLAPLHQPHTIAGITAMIDLMPGVPQVACFDTGFHRDHAFEVAAFALPLALYHKGVRRYGFHGLSYDYLSAALPVVAPDLGRPDARVVAAHLGNGCSMCGLIGGRSVDSSMGFTALDGLPMGTRCGSLDPGVVLYLLDELGMTTAEVTRMLYRDSGLAGLSGIGNDMRLLQDSDDPAAARAIDLFVHRIAREVGALAAGLGGLDALVFTAGIGENSAPLRAAVMARCRWLGVVPDPVANQAPGRAARRISADSSAVQCWVVPTDEELMVARHTRKLVTGMARR